MGVILRYLILMLKVTLRKTHVAAIDMDTNWVLFRYML